MTDINNNALSIKPKESALNPEVHNKDSEIVRSARQTSSRNSNISSSTTNEVGTEKVTVKKLPPIKAPVGLAKGPDLKNCKSKVNSLHNIKHTPASSGVTIQTQKLKWNAKSKIGSLENKEHQPGGGATKVESRKLEWKATSKVQSLQNVKHKPAGGNVKIFNESYVNKSTKKSDQTSFSPEEDKRADLAKKVTTNESKNHSDLLTKDLKNLKM